MLSMSLHHPSFCEMDTIFTKAEALGIEQGILGLIGAVDRLENFYGFCYDIRDTLEDIQCLNAESATLRSMMNTSDAINYLQGASEFLLVPKAFLMTSRRWRKEM